MSYTEDLKKAGQAELPWEMLAGKNILIVGATGLIGGCLVELLLEKKDADYNVFAAGRNEGRASSRFAKYAADPRYHFLKMDITRQIQSDTDFHFIIDAASGASPKIYATDPVGVMKANIYGVDHLLTYGLSHHAEKMVYVSSGEVYGEGDGRAFEEDYSGYVNPATPRACYPSSKRAAETLCVSYASQYDCGVSIARPSHVYGPHFTESDDRVYAQFIRNIVRGEDIVMKSSGEQFRSWCYVVDCARALLFILLKGGQGEAYNVADDASNITIRQLADMIAGIGGRRTVMQLPAEEERRGYSVVKHAVFSTRKLEALGWSADGEMKDKIRSTIMEVKSAGGAADGRV